MTRQNQKLRRSRSTRPQVEGLEDRLLLYSTVGGRWQFGSRITYSFAPDGTRVGGIPSNLFQSMAARGISQQVWQEHIQRAAAVWQTVAGINLALVADDGSPFSTTGNQQGDPRFGDIRIAGTPQGSNVLGLCFLPPPINGGTVAGDLVMNTNQAWQVNNDFDLQTVAIHEIGHALGMGHSAIASAAMCGYYMGMKQALNSDDTAGIQSIYGPRQPDAFDAARSNQTFSTATNINSYVSSTSQAALPGLDITTATDADYYYVVAPKTTNGTLTVSMQSSDLSSLSPRVVLYNSSLLSLGSSTAPNSYGSTVTVSITGVSPGQGFYVRASAANGGPSGTGAYGLLVDFGASVNSRMSAQASIAPPVTVVPEQPDQGGGSMNLSWGGRESFKNILARLGLLEPHDDDALPVRIGNLTAVGHYLTTDGPSSDHDHDHDHLPVINLSPLNLESTREADLIAPAATTPELATWPKAAERLRQRFPGALKINR